MYNLIIRLLIAFYVYNSKKKSESLSKGKWVTKLEVYSYSGVLYNSINDWSGTRVTCVNMDGSQKEWVEKTSYRKIDMLPFIWSF